mgnify:CR=1 FL=1
MSKPPKRPAPIPLLPLIAYAKRPPTRNDPRWAWQVVYRGNDGDTHVLSGRFSEREMSTKLAEMHVEQRWEVRHQSVGIVIASLNGPEASLSRRTCSGGVAGIASTFQQQVGDQAGEDDDHRAHRPDRQQQHLLGLGRAFVFLARRHVEV